MNKNAATHYVYLKKRSTLDAAIVAFDFAIVKYDTPGSWKCLLELI